jgi:hypothetical protein
MALETYKTPGAQQPVVTGQSTKSEPGAIQLATTSARFSRRPLLNMGVGR